MPLATYPVFALMINVPTINSKPPPILLRPRPLNRQIRMTHKRLTNIIKAMIHMLLLRFKQSIVHLSGIIIVHARFERERERAEMVQAVQLVEHGDVVDVALFGWFAGWELVVRGVSDEDEAVARWVEGAPGFVC